MDKPISAAEFIRYAVLLKVPGVPPTPNAEPLKSNLVPVVSAVVDDAYGIAFDVNAEFAPVPPLVAANGLVVSDKEEALIALPAVKLATDTCLVVEL
jgi:hypothetical protein